MTLEFLSRILGTNFLGKMARAHQTMGQTPRPGMVFHRKDRSRRKTDVERSPADKSEISSENES